MSSAESQPRLIAAKFAGQRGPQFTQWAKEYLDAAAGKGDEDGSWADCYLGQDPQAGLSAVQTRRRTQRRRESYSALTAAAIGAVAGSLLNQHLEAEPCFTFSCVDTSLMPAEFAFLGDRIASGLMTPMYSHHDGVAEMLIDSGATSHMVDNAHKLSRITATNPHGRDVRVANGHIIRATHVGEMDVTVNARYRRKANKHENCATVMTLTDVLVVPGLNTDLFSCTAAFERDGIRSYFNDERHLVLPDGGKVTFVEGGHRRKSLIKYHQTRADAYLAASSTGAANDMVHNMLAHFSPDRIAMARARMKTSPSRSLRAAEEGSHTRASHRPAGRLGVLDASSERVAGGD